MKPILHVDINNCYVSCERVFNGKLRGKPVLVLSNNDGCAIARSNEAKALGIAMAKPIFEIKDIIEKYKVILCSSNLILYYDMSRRFMLVLRNFSPQVEEYSIDEAFLNLEGFESRNLTEYGHEIKSTLYQWLGLPVTIGIAPTKTMAKLANKIAKKSVKANGVLDLMNPHDQEVALKGFDVADVWKIGPARAAILKSYGIKTAWDLRNVQLNWIDKKIGVEGIRAVKELRGEPCYPLELTKPHKKHIGCGKSFGTKVTSLEEIKEGVASHLAEAAVRLRADGQVAGELIVYLQTNPFSKTPQYNAGAKVELPLPTDDTGELIGYAEKAVESIYKPGYIYKRPHIDFDKLCPNDQIQENLFIRRDRERIVKLMSALDNINLNFGKGKLRYLAEGIEKAWKTRFEMRSKRYTTRWDELLTVRA